MKKTSPLKFDLRKSYLAMIQNAPGTKMFQHLWFTVGSTSKDIVTSGELSCGYFVSTVLHRFQLIEEPHATVAGTVTDMRQRGWKKIRVVRPGAVVRWAAVPYPDRKAHEHIGFAVSATQAISNSTSKKVPHLHHLTYGKKSAASYRPVMEIWWHPKLGK